MVRSLVLWEEDAACGALLWLVGAGQEVRGELLPLAVEATCVGTVNSHQFTVLGVELCVCVHARVCVVRGYTM